MSNRRLWTNRPPIDGEAIFQARIDKGMSQEEVQDACAELGVKVWNLSRIEAGTLKWPHPRAVKVLAEVLELKIADMYQKAAA